MSDSHCERCERLQRELEAERARNAQLAQRIAELEKQLVETVKLSELQAADLERYKRAYDQSRPNHPERAPKEQLQLAFERVLAELGAEDPANDAEPEEETAGANNQGPQGCPSGQGRGGRRGGKRRDPHGRRNLDMENLPVIEDRREPAEVLAAEGKGFRLIGSDISQYVAWRPGEWVRYRVIRSKYVKDQSIADRDHAATASEGSAGSHQADSAVIVAPLPDNVWPRVMGDPSAIARVIVSKYDDLLPLNRQQSISARRGFSLPKATQCGWLAASHPYCAAVVDAMFADSKRNAHLIATDATSVPVLPEQRNKDGPESLSPGKRPRCDRWQVMVFIADRDHVIFRYDRENNGQVLSGMLDGYHGNLLADAASVFDVLYREHGMTEHGCWFHCRRPFYRALETEPERALEALSMIAKLFEIDRDLRQQELDLNSYTRLRAERSRPILELFDSWVKRYRGCVDPRGPLSAGITYYDNQRDALHRFVGDGRIRLDNNWSEQALRKLVLGLDNWLFFANERGLEWYTTFRSLIASCVLHRLNPEIYIEQLLRLARHWPEHRMLELSPKYWLKTVEQLSERQRTIVSRPWEPNVVLSAALSEPKTSHKPNHQAA